ncbi:propanediol utilization protein [Actibacterium pelagium]|uniref:Threonine kinase n=1 Tax=Actibacterium pelagium TaxID=2029103 RepID=A0A917ALZ2_9RHOB|nr:propanediol utilization protein [Actibacterium pelagium]GGE60628.1 hypothetical protein GCM10011517_30200 [Actibacterium pelagium]
MTIRRAQVYSHFGEILQGKLGPNGPVALVTLPSCAFQAEARWSPSPGLRLTGTTPRAVTPTQLRQLAKALGTVARGQFLVRVNMPLGGGAGASTASLSTLAKLIAPEAMPDEIAKACVSVEGASDPIMYRAPGRLLWASRRAKVLDHLPPLPRFDVVGGFFGQPERTCPANELFPDIADLTPELSKACGKSDPSALADIATESARRCLALRGRSNDPTDDLIARTGALGMVIAHTGSARGLIFAPGTVPANIKPVLLDAGLRGLVTFKAGGNQ